MGSVYKPKRTENGKQVKYRCWYIVYLDEHGRRRKKKGFRDKTASEALMRRLERDAERKRAGETVPDRRHQLKPIAEAIEDYLLNLLRQGTPTNSTHHKESRAVLTKISTACAWPNVAAINASDFTAYLGKLHTAGKAPRTQGKYHEILRAFCNWCVRQSWLDKSPLQHLKKPRLGEKGKRRLRRAFTREEFHRLIAVAAKRQAIYTIAATSGLRRAELNKLEKRDCDPRGDQPKWTIRGEITKNGKEARLPMSRECAAAMLPFWEAAETATTRLIRVPMIKTLRRDMEKAGIPPQDQGGRWLDFHSFRYFFCTSLANVLPIQTVKVLMRHSTIKLTADLYCTLGLEDMMETVWNLPPLLPANNSTLSAPTGAPANNSARSPSP